MGRKTPHAPSVFLLSASLFLVVLASRLCHADVLWADEDYHLAAAIQVLHGKIPYRDFWYDKPPLNLAFYLLFDARTGVVLRVADTLFVCLCCALAYRLAASLWSRREGLLAAGVLAFFLIFYLPPGVIPLEPDTLILAPELAALYWACKRRALLAGIAAGLAFQLNPKGVFVLASAIVFDPAAALILLVGFVIPNAVILSGLAAIGALTDYFEQVWKWGWLYVASSPADPRALIGWLGFHTALLVSAGWYWVKDKSPPRVQTILWCVLSLAAAAVRWRFAPRYFIPLLGALVIPAARGFARAPHSVRILATLTLLIPAIRFGPRYVELAVGQPWKDIAMDRESREAAQVIKAAAHPGDTIFIWGYRPDIVAYTRLPVAGRIWDSQLLTGVPADRHLSDARPISVEWPRQNRQELLRSNPIFMVDGLSLYNPQLDIHRYADLAPWLGRYCVLARVGRTTVYHLCAP